MKETETSPSTIRNKIRWNGITWYSQILAVFLGIAVFSLGFWVGSQEGRNLEAENMNLTKENIILTQLFEEAEKKMLLAQIPGLSGVCEAGITALPEGLYEFVENQMIERYPSYSFDIEKIQYNSTPPRRMHSLGLFNCHLSDDIFVASYVYEDTELEEPFPVYIKVAVFSAKGDIIQVIPQGNGIKYSTSWHILGEVIDGNLNFTMRATNPCYDLFSTYNINLETGEFTKQVEGGEDMECWKN